MKWVTAGTSITLGSLRAANIFSSFFFKFFPLPIPYAFVTKTSTLSILALKLLGTVFSLCRVIDNCFPGERKTKGLFIFFWNFRYHSKTLAKADTIYNLHSVFTILFSQFWRRECIYILLLLILMSSYNLQQAALDCLIIYCFDAESN